MNQSKDFNKNCRTSDENELYLKKYKLEARTNALKNISLTLIYSAGPKFCFTPFSPIFIAKVSRLQIKKFCEKIQIYGGSFQGIVSALENFAQLT